MLTQATKFGICSKICKKKTATVWSLFVGSEEQTLCRFLWKQIYSGASCTWQNSCGPQQGQRDGLIWFRSVQSPVDHPPRESEIDLSIQMLHLYTKSPFLSQTLSPRGDDWWPTSASPFESSALPTQMCVTLREFSVLLINPRRSEWNNQVT